MFIRLFINLLLFSLLNNIQSSESISPNNIPLNELPHTPDLLAGPIKYLAKYISVGAYHSCTITYMFAIRCWGRNSSGQSKVPLMFQGYVTHVSAGHSNTCLMHGRRFYCFGSNLFGQNDIPFIVKNNPFYNPYTTIEAGNNFICSIFGLRMQLQCWGDSKNYATMVPQDYEFKMLSVQTGSKHACGLRAKRIMKDMPQLLECWGMNSDGQIDIPHTVKTGIVYNYAVGTQHNCALLDVFMECWGSNSHGQSSVPPVYIKDFRTQTVIAGNLLTCLIINQKKVCWGETNLNKGLRKFKNQPVGFDNFVIWSMGLGMDQACAVDYSGDTVCWGSNYQGQCESKIRDK